MLQILPKGIYFPEKQELKQLHSDYKTSLVLNTIFLIIKKILIHYLLKTKHSLNADLVNTMIDCVHFAFWKLCAQKYLPKKHLLLQKLCKMKSPL